MSGTDADRLARIDTEIAGIDEDWGSPLVDLVFVRRLLDAATSRPSAPGSSEAEVEEAASILTMLEKAVAAGDPHRELALRCKDLRAALSAIGQGEHEPS